MVRRCAGRPGIRSCPSRAGGGGPAHVADFASDPGVFAATARRAAELVRWAPRPMNVITSRGREATQSVFHLHLHLVPRAANDGLALPWYSGRTKEPR
ncbi:HIT domain-containing protein [Streptomyces sp. NPDC005722]